VCRRYPGTYRHPLDPALIALPWWLKEAIAWIELDERATYLGGPHAQF
jgi:hypothetical protein